MSTSKRLIRALTLALVFHTIAASAAALTVPGTANPWLAGMPDGSVAYYGDVAPAQSPVLVFGVSLVPGSLLTFTVSGGVHFGGPGLSPPDGVILTPHTSGAENGMSDVIAPADALMGVFLGPLQPSAFPAPAALDFSTSASRDYFTIAPLLQQVFFIGDGLTTGGARQQILVPNGATRLYLGSMDGYGWAGNTGSFSVQVAPSACQDGIDNDGDGPIDYPADPGCSSATDLSEGYDCGDGIDDDGDGLIDYPADPGCSSPTDASEQAPNLACDDGADNDGDGLVDFPADPGCEAPASSTESPACQDGLDNDGFGGLDFDGGASANGGVALGAPDPDCLIASQDTEGPRAACDDGADNDGDGLVDFPADPGCEAPASSKESPACQDGLDNDGFGGLDFDGGASANGGVALGAPDPDCLIASQDTEGPRAVCDDGGDNDGDGLVDFPADPGCDSPSDASEKSPVLVCDDGDDNDGDGSIDFPSDPGCASPIDASEKSPTLVCDDGGDNDSDGLVDYPADPGCWGATDASETPTPPFLVTKTADTNDSVCDVDCSLREAVTAANTTPGADVVRLPAGVFPLPLTGGEIFLEDAVTIQGAGAQQTVVEGGGFVFTSDVAFESLSIRSANAASAGAIVCFFGCSLRLDSVSLQDNPAAGLALLGDGSVVIRNSSIVRNGENGIGGYAYQYWTGSFTLENSTVSDNGGAGIELEARAAVRILSSTLLGNGGPGLSPLQGFCCFFLAAAAAGAPGVIELDHVILAGNNHGGVQCGSAATLASLGYNIAGDASCNLTQPSDRPTTDPLLGPLAVAPNGTWTCPPLAGSPALDGGNPVGCPDASGALLGRDQRGAQRPLDGNGDGLAICDIGAHELTAHENGLDDDDDGAGNATDNCRAVANRNQRDTDGDGYGNVCDADLNQDGVVNFGDLAKMKSVFFKADEDADLNGDGVVNFADLAIMKQSFFKAPGPAAGKP